MGESMSLSPSVKKKENVWLNRLNTWIPFSLSMVLLLFFALPTMSEMMIVEIGIGVPDVLALAVSLSLISFGIIICAVMIVVIGYIILNPVVLGYGKLCRWLSS